MFMKNFTHTLFLVLIIAANAYSQSSATYDISVTTIWNMTDHTSVPGGAHWSPLAGATHKNLNDVLQFGMIAPMTNGIKDIAETGNTTNFQNEISSLITAGTVKQYLQQGFAPFAGNASVAALSDVVLDQEFPYITLVSMVAPSPDWFIAINSESLRSGNNAVNNGWKDTYTVDMFAYDAGTDEGTNYTSTDAASNPRTNIEKINDAPINGKRMGTITFTFKGATLSTINTNPINNIKVFPNPTNGKVSVSNIKDANLKSVEIYSVLGRLIKQIIVEKSITEFTINLSNLNKGMYILKLNSFENISQIERLIVE